jgi:glycosyltransferase involved in cell wall biosynthesis
MTARVSKKAVPESPRATIVMPCWRDGATVGEAIGDIRAQTGVAWEAVVVFDGVDDHTRAAAVAAIDGDARIRVLDRPHAGLVAALNAGVEAARTPIIARFDADDRMLPERLARQVAWLDAHPHATVVAAHVAWGSLDAASDGRGMERHIAWLATMLDHDDIAAMRFVDAPVAHPAVAYRRDAVLPFGPYRHGDFAEDHDLWLRLIASGHRFGVIPEPLVTWRDRPGRLTRSDVRYRDDRRKRLVHEHLVAGPVGEGRPLLVWGAGVYGRRHVRGLRAVAEMHGIRLQFRAFIDIDPQKIGRVLQGDVPVVGPETLGPPDGSLLLVAVAAAGARALIEDELRERGWQREHDYLLLQ